ncbi:L-lactate MFS transporter [Haloplasma contractile]|uniref:Oxalate-formate antiporter protein n=1 Tax=Haloplasma contractile SSD-17B TaxID=1033810 RepID=U2FGQ7_9MOLU|nr:OFA family MFS transporter [Haloplasma contractile]ERJ12030.1 Oxalate-formate antiporter protein [Haloplasma contractile SSD-17B]
MITHNKWSVLIGAVVAQLCVGTIYTWSLYNNPLMEKHGFTEPEVVLTFSIATFMFAFATIFSGKLQDRIGPRIVATIGGILYGGGLILSSFVSNITLLYFFYGVISGIGVGFVYVCPITTCVKWFPHKKGMITGISVGAFGLGSFIFKFIIQGLLDTVGVSNTMMIIGLIYLTLIIIASQFLVVPELSKTKTGSLDHTKNELTVKQMIHTKTFYFVWLLFFFGCTSGLLVIGLAKDIGMKEAGLELHTAANAVALIALFNAGGRLIWGSLSDRIGRLTVVLFMFIITSICMLLLSVVSLNLYLFFLLVAGIAFCFGGFLAVFPIITGELFGSRNLGSNYGVMYQAYGIAALAGPFINLYVNNLKTTFIVASMVALLGALITLILSSKVEFPSTSRAS